MASRKPYMSRSLEGAARMTGALNGIRTAATGLNGDEAEGFAAGILSKYGFKRGDYLGRLSLVFKLQREQVREVMGKGAGRDVMTTLWLTRLQQLQQAMPAVSPVRSVFAETVVLRERVVAAPEASNAAGKQPAASPSFTSGAPNGRPEGQRLERPPTRHAELTPLRSPSLDAIDRSSSKRPAGQQAFWTRPAIVGRRIDDPLMTHKPANRQAIHRSETNTFPTGKPVFRKWPAVHEASARERPEAPAGIVRLKSNGNLRIDPHNESPFLPQALFAAPNKRRIRTALPPFADRPSRLPYPEADEIRAVRPPIGYRERPGRHSSETLPPQSRQHPFANRIIHTTLSLLQRKSPIPLARNARNGPNGRMEWEPRHFRSNYPFHNEHNDGYSASPARLTYRGNPISARANAGPKARAADSIQLTYKRFTTADHGGDSVTTIGSANRSADGSNLSAATAVSGGQSASKAAVRRSSPSLPNVPDSYRPRLPALIQRSAAARSFTTSEPEPFHRLTVDVPFGPSTLQDGAVAGFVRTGRRWPEAHGTSIFRLPSDAGMIQPRLSGQAASLLGSNETVEARRHRSAPFVHAGRKTADSQLFAGRPSGSPTGGPRRPEAEASARPSMRRSDFERAGSLSPFASEPLAQAAPSLRRGLAQGALPNEPAYGGRRTVFRPAEPAALAVDRLLVPFGGQGDKPSRFMAVDAFSRSLIHKSITGMGAPVAEISADRRETSVRAYAGTYPDKRSADGRRSEPGRIARLERSYGREEAEPIRLRRDLAEAGRLTAIRAVSPLRRAEESMAAAARALRQQPAALFGPSLPLLHAGVWRRSILPTVSAPERSYVRKPSADAAGRALVAEKPALPDRFEPDAFRQAYGSDRVAHRMSIVALGKSQEAAGTDSLLSAGRRKSADEPIRLEIKATAPRRSPFAVPVSNDGKPGGPDKENGTFGPRDSLRPTSLDRVRGRSGIPSRPAFSETIGRLRLAAFPRANETDSAAWAAFGAVFRGPGRIFRRLWPVQGGESERRAAQNVGRDLADRPAASLPHGEDGRLREPRPRVVERVSRFLDGFQGIRLSPHRLATGEPGGVSAAADSGYPFAGIGTFARNRSVPLPDRIIPLTNRITRSRNEAGPNGHDWASPAFGAATGARLSAVERIEPPDGNRRTGRGADGAQDETAAPFASMAVQRAVARMLGHINIVSSASSAHGKSGIAPFADIASDEPARTLWGPRTAAAMTARALAPKGPLLAQRRLAPSYLGIAGEEGGTAPLGAERGGISPGHRVSGSPSAAAAFSADIANTLRLTAAAAGGRTSSQTTSYWPPAGRLAHLVRAGGANGGASGEGGAGFAAEREKAGRRISPTPRIGTALATASGRFAPIADDAVRSIRRYAADGAGRLPPAIRYVHIATAGWPIGGVPPGAIAADRGPGGRRIASGARMGTVPAMAADRPASGSGDAARPIGRVAAAEGAGRLSPAIRLTPVAMAGRLTGGARGGSLAADSSPAGRGIASRVRLGPVSTSAADRLPFVAADSPRRIRRTAAKEPERLPQAIRLAHIASARRWPGGVEDGAANADNANRRSQTAARSPFVSAGPVSNGNAPSAAITTFARASMTFGESDRSERAATGRGAAPAIVRRATADRTENRETGRFLNRSGAEPAVFRSMSRIVAETHTVSRIIGLPEIGQTRHRAVGDNGGGGAVVVRRAAGPFAAAGPILYNVNQRTHIWHNAPVSKSGSVPGGNAASGGLGRSGKPAAAELRLMRAAATWAARGNEAASPGSGKIGLSPGTERRGIAPAIPLALAAPQARMTSPRAAVPAQTAGAAIIPLEHKLKAVASPADPGFDPAELDYRKTALRAAQPETAQEAEPAPAQIDMDELRELVQKLPQFDIKKIAERVYREIERNMRFDRQTRGM